MRQKKTAEQRNTEAGQREADRKYRADFAALEVIKEQSRRQFKGIALTGVPEKRLLPTRDYE